MIDTKYIYLIGTEKSGYCGMTINEKEAKNFVKHRKRFKYVKVSSKKISNIIDINNMSSHDEIVYGYGKYLMFGYEEEYFLESFDTFITDIIFNIESLNKILSVMKFDDNEIPYINILFRVLEMYVFDQSHGTFDEYGIDKYFDLGKACDKFIKNVLDGTGHTG